MSRIDLSVRICNGRLTQIGQSFRYKMRERHAVFQCECSKKKIINVRSVKRGATLSCGCLRDEILVKMTTTHGHYTSGRVSPTLESWKGMHKRCSDNASELDRKNYYDRGIRVCARWVEFKNFIEDMGERPEGFTIERVNNDGDYSPSNCRWIPRNEQACNKQNTVWVPVDGVMMCAAKAARFVGMNIGTLLSRIENGWSPERAISTPVVQHKMRDV